MRSPCIKTVLSLRARPCQETYVADAVSVQGGQLVI